MLWYKETWEEEKARKARWKRKFVWLWPVSCIKLEAMPYGPPREVYHCHAWLQWVYVRYEYCHGHADSGWEARYCLYNPDLMKRGENSSSEEQVEKKADIKESTTSWGSTDLYAAYGIPRPKKYDTIKKKHK